MEGSPGNSPLLPKRPLPRAPAPPTLAQVLAQVDPCNAFLLSEVMVGAPILSPPALSIPQPRAGPVSPAPCSPHPQLPMQKQTPQRPEHSLGKGDGPREQQEILFADDRQFFPPALTADPLTSVSLPQANTFQSDITLYPD